jgi:hemerythrin
MPQIAWKGDLSVGLPEIDADHQNLIRIYNDFDRAAEEGRGEEQLAATLEQLVHYVSYHFRHEESFFIRTNYPDYEIHKKDHERWMNHISEIYGGLRTRPMHETQAAVQEFLRVFISGHVMVLDRKFGLYFNSSHIML